MESDLKRKRLDQSDSVCAKKLKTGLGAHYSWRLVNLKSRYSMPQLSSIDSKAIPEQSASVTPSSNLLKINALRKSFYTEKRITKYKKFDDHVSVKTLESKVLKEIQEKDEPDDKKIRIFKARPAPEYRSPLKPMKSMKKLTVPIDLVLHTDIRADLRQRSMSVYKD
jgi:hypothetical protein